MTTETILTDHQIGEEAAALYGTEVTAQEIAYARAIEQAVLQSDEVNRMRKEANCITSRGTPFGGLVLDTAIDIAMGQQL